MQRTQDQKEQHSTEHAKHEEPVSVHREPYQVNKYNQDMMNPQNQGAGACIPPPQERHAGKHSKYLAAEDAIHV
jgi:hypothetical protein